MHVQTSRFGPAVHVTFAWPVQDLPWLVEPPGQPPPSSERIRKVSPSIFAQESGIPGTRDEAGANPRMIIIGGGGHLGRTKIQPALLGMPLGIADCLERASIQS